MSASTPANEPAVSFPVAPRLAASLWLNTTPLTLEQLRGRVVVLHAFQMLCPGCVSHGLPQAVEIQRAFDPGVVAVLGLHSVFEHHEAMTPVTLRAFVHEYRLTFPIAIDQPSETGPLPRTMLAYRMQGTPTLVLIDRCGRLRAQYFGAVSDLLVGAEIGRLLAEPATGAAAEVTPSDPASPGPPLRCGC